MPWYSQGQVAVTANSDTVTGTGTAFSANARVGDAFRGPDGRWYEITNIASATVLSIRPNYQGTTASGQAYTIAPMQGYVKESADRLRQLVDQYGSQLSALQPWAYAPTLDAAQTAFGMSASGKEVATGTAAQARTALDTPSATALKQASPSILIVDQLRRSVEVATGGRQTVLYTAKGQPSHMYVLPRFNCEDVAPGGELGTGTHPAFLFNGTPAQEIFVGAHLASEVAGEAVSRPFADPRTSINFDQSRAMCQASGPGWDLMSNLDWAAIALWCMANGYEPLGNTNWGRHHTKRWETGRRVDTLQPGEAAGTGRTLTGSGPASWAHDGTPAGIQDLVGNVWEWVGGMKMVNGRAWLAPDNGKLTESQFVDSGFDMPTTRVFSTASAAGASALVKQSLIAPASASLAPQGHLYTDLTAERLPLRGGSWYDSSSAGLGALRLNVARTGAGSSLGFRPRFRAL
uniref:hypothetical protein n=1 Tax=Stutzerimonas nitrititolerans TaxID=2482751 RepID=UPI0035E44EF6